MAKKTIVGALGVIQKNGKVLMGLRHDPERPDLNGKWEFPGGGVEFEERPEEAVVREVKEEVGIKVKVIGPVSYAIVEYDLQQPDKLRYILFPYYCKIISGKIKPSDAEITRVKWIDPKKVIPDECMPYTKELLASVIKSK